jgi:hypothetical protein
MQRLRGQRDLHTRQKKKQMQRLRGQQYLYARQGKKQMQRLRGRQYLHAWQEKKRLQRLRGQRDLHARQTKKPMQGLQLISITMTIAFLCFFDAVIAFLATNRRLRGGRRFKAASFVPLARYRVFLDRSLLVVCPGVMRMVGEDGVCPCRGIVMLCSYWGCT